jgi:hypothetical protein
MDWNGTSDRGDLRNPHLKIEMWGTRVICKLGCGAPAFQADLRALGGAAGYVLVLHAATS